jgi:putative SOS response-associated peptidase YedK
MCGRFNLRSSLSTLVEQFLPGIAPESLPELSPRYNIAPTQQIACIVAGDADCDPATFQRNDRRRCEMMHWGLVPAWADDLAIGNRMINARAETAAEKPSFRSAFKKRRCIIPADGYFEWKATADGKQPYEFYDASNRLLAIAGLWETNRKVLDRGAELHSCTILTTAANSFAGEVHNRMPVLLDPASWDAWLDPENQRPEDLQPLLVAAPDGMLAKRAVSRKLNNVRNQGADVLQFEQQA